jgi:hypothetical protein
MQNLPLNEIQHDLIQKRKLIMTESICAITSLYLYYLAFSLGYISSIFIDSSEEKTLLLRSIWEFA